MSFHHFEIVQLTKTAILNCHFLSCKTEWRKLSVLQNKGKKEKKIGVFFRIYCAFTFQQLQLVSTWAFTSLRPLADAVTAIEADRTWSRGMGPFLKYLLLLLRLAVLFHVAHLTEVVWQREAESAPSWTGGSEKSSLPSTCMSSGDGATINEPALLCFVSHLPGHTCWQSA